MPLGDISKVFDLMHVGELEVLHFKLLTCHYPLCRYILIAEMV